MVDPLNVDTSLDGTGSTMSTGVQGIDSPTPSWLSADAMFPTVSQQDFTEALQGQPVKFTGVAAKGNGSLREQMVQYGKQFLGQMYKWGGSSPETSFDCSGFIKYVYGHFGVQLPRVSFQQANAGQRVGIGQALPGDIVWWDNSSRNQGADHVALYLGGGKIMEFYKTGKPSRIRQLGKDEDYAITRIKLPGE